MNYVQPSYAENVCDSTREEEIVVFYATAISTIFVKKVTRLLHVQSTCNSSVSKIFKNLFRIFEITMILIVTTKIAESKHSFVS